MTTWVRVDTKFIGHPKVLDIGPLGEALWLRGLCYAGEQLTDGFIPTTFVKRMGDMKGLVIAARLVDAGLWEDDEGGYRIHDFLDWQRSRDEVADVSSKRAEAGRRGGKQKASNLLAKGQQSGSNLSSKTLPDTYVDTDTDAKESRTELVTTPPTPSSEGKPKPQRSIKTPIPDDLAEVIPRETWATIREEQRLTDEQLLFETSQMVDHFQSKGERRPDWVAGWRKWMRSEYRQSKPLPISGPDPTEAYMRGEITSPEQLLNFRRLAS